MFEFPHKEASFRFWLISIFDEKSGFFKKRSIFFFGEFDVKRFVFFVVEFKGKAIAVVLKLTRDVFTLVIEVVIEEDLLHGLEAATFFAHE